VIRRVRPLAERFWPKVSRRGVDECWPWTGAMRADRGTIRAGRAVEGMLTSNRAAWLAAKGPIPEGMNVLHTCDNAVCCNPGHLYLGTHLDNEADKKARNRHARGQTHGRSKLRRAS